MRRLSVGFIVLWGCCLCCPAGGQQITKHRDGIETQFPPMAVFDPLHQKPVAYKDRFVRATLIIGKVRHAIQLKSRASVGVVQLPEELAQVDEIRRVKGNQLAVIGMVNGSGSEVVLVGIKTLKLTDKFVCYRPAVSPDGAYIAFVKFYPAHFIEGTSDHYMEYVVEKGGAANRPPGVPVEDNVDVGTAFYPPGVGNQYSDNVSRPLAQQHLGVSNFFWNADSTQMLFADRYGDAIDVVMVDSQINSGVKVKRAPSVPLTEFCKSTGLSAVAFGNCYVLMRHVDFIAPEAKVKMIFQVVGRPARVLEYGYSQFK